MELLKHTFFINLSSRVDRLIEVKKELLDWGIESPERFDAIKMKDSAVGCTLSHIKCLEIAKARKYPYVFICEDDIHCVDIPLLRSQLTEFKKSSKLDSWDILLIAGNNAPPYRTIKPGLVQVYNCQTTTGYIVQQHYYDTLITNMREGLQKLLRDPQNRRELAIDMYWKNLQRNDRWLILTPLCVVQRESYSDIEGRVVDYSSMMLDHEKRWMQTKMQQMTYVERA